jgi:hypothetical protein
MVEYDRLKLGIHQFMVRGTVKFLERGETA